MAYLMARLHDSRARPFHLMESQSQIFKLDLQNSERNYSSLPAVFFSPNMPKLALIAPRPAARGTRASGALHSTGIVRTSLPCPTCNPHTADATTSRRSPDVAAADNVLCLPLRDLLVFTFLGRNAHMSRTSMRVVLPSAKQQSLQSDDDASSSVSTFQTSALRVRWWSASRFANEGTLDPLSSMSLPYSAPVAALVPPTSGEALGAVVGSRI
ncbi:hypothetical protein D9758_002956 [Tetrapyrgos nigripes]|uniref:Uncharacterized protein n=1 Tax=Tetrapyrgos nigripes TaxID=182062 RepID=A0A8H5LTE8_9AGAR|nr:hypothetical protein D9758_002956 [Tetrapyrgos nigripes]